MPMKAPYLCRCGATVPAGGACECAIARKKDYEQRRGSARKRGYDAAWERARAAYLREHKWCVGKVEGRQCGQPATVVDHVRPHGGDKSLFWDKANWQPLCGPCHSAKTAGADGGFGNRPLHGTGLRRNDTDLSSFPARPKDRVVLG